MFLCPLTHPGCYLCVHYRFNLGFIEV